MVEKLFATTLRLIRDCECEEVCPSCIYSPKCGNENDPLDKEAAIIILVGLQEIMKTRKARKGEPDVTELRTKLL